jgi:CheY-like chemotaxis protein
VADASTQTVPSLRILIAEDNAVNQKTLLEMLKRDGHRVVTVNNGAEAVEKVLRGGIDLVLMDIQMPVMDGLEAARRIRSHPAGGALPIIAITAHAMPGEREIFLSKGLDDYLAKPIDREELRSILQRHAL